MRWLTFQNTLLATLLAVSLVFFCSFKWKSNQWIYNIASDGKGYYVYLPAIFIYHDLSYRFVEKIEASYNPGSIQPPVTTLPDGKKLNKYFAGEALLLAPFFLLTHTIALLFHLQSDGYSFIYNAMMSVAAVFYSLSGLWLLGNFLKKFKVSNQVITFTLLLVFGASPLLHYTWMEPSMSHAYSFFAVNLVLASTACFFKTQRSIFLILIFVSLGLVFLIRPVNLLIVLSIPFIVGLLEQKNTFSLFLNHKAMMLTGLLLFVAFVFIQLILYKKQIGSWWVWAYTNEGFNFSKPHFFEFLFSFRKGWLVYTPVVLLSLLSALLLWRSQLRLTLLFFTPLLVILYVASSWYDWAYGASFGCRPMTEFTGYALIPLALLFQKLKQNYAKAFMIVICWCFLLLNSIQVYQINKHILLWDNMDFKAYKASFLKTSDQSVNMLE